MSLATKTKKAEKLGIDLKKIEEEAGAPLTEEKLDELIEAKQAQIDQDEKEEKIRKEAEIKAAEEAKKKQFILKDVDGDDVDQADYFYPRLEEEPVFNAKGEKTGVLKPTTDTAPSYFNRICGVPVDREDLLEVFNNVFPRKKGFLFYKLRDKEMYLVIVPLKYAKTVNKENESRPGDFQRHAISFINEGSVNLDSLKMKLGRIYGHSSISTEPLV